MFKEIREILIAFKTAQQQGRQAALATVVHVEGSSYRRPGARMLVEDNGKMTGAISGGCLEGDALKKAMLAISQGQNKLITYNTLLEDDVEFGVQLGCNGIVHILFEPIHPGQTNNPIALLEKCVTQRKNAVLITLFSLKNFYDPQPGTCFFYNGGHSIINDKYPNLGNILLEDAVAVLSNKFSIIKSYDDYELTGFVELLEPPVSLIVAGAGNDTLPLVEMATVLGWQITMLDGRATHANRQRFPRAHRIIVGKAFEAMQQVAGDEWTVFVVMTHNFNYDLELIPLLLKRECRYIGILGPRKRLERLFTELQQQGISIDDEQMSAIYGPIGLDLGAEAPEEIALSILSEIKAVLAERPGSSLKNKRDGIHTRAIR